jgi:hypothetical protein
MNNPDHIFENLENQYLGIKYSNYLRIRDPGWKRIGSGIRDGKHSDPGPGINIPDPQHCSYHFFFLGLLLRVWLEKTVKNSFVVILSNCNLSIYCKYGFHEPI